MEQATQTVPPPPPLASTVTADDFKQAVINRILAPFIFATILALPGWAKLIWGSNLPGALGEITGAYGGQFFAFFLAGWLLHRSGKRTWKKAFGIANWICFGYFILIGIGQNAAARH